MCLFDCRAVEAGGADFEFENQENAADHQDNISALSHARYREFEQDVPSAKVTHRLLEDGALLYPCIPLRKFKMKPVRLC